MIRWQPIVKCFMKRVCDQIIKLNMLVMNSICLGLETLHGKVTTFWIKLEMIVYGKRLRIRQKSMVFLYYWTLLNKYHL